jgi:hypothetical protein
VLTNGTAPFIRRIHQLAELAAGPHALSFRVSIDYPDETRQDGGAGLRISARRCKDCGCCMPRASLAITRQMSPGEDALAIDAAFRMLLRLQRLPEDLQILALPELGEPEQHTAARPQCAAILRLRHHGQPHASAARQRHARIRLPADR